MSLERILVVDDEPLVQRALESILRARRIQCSLAGSIAMAEKLLRDPESFDVVMLDVRLPDGDGQRFLEQLMALPQHPLVVMITGHGSIENAVSCMRAGAFDYIIKPFQPAQIDLLLRKAENYSQLIKVNRYFSERETGDGEESLIGRSPSMVRLKQLVDRVAPTDATVLITGEHGSGKEKVAHDIYRNSPRRSEAYIKVNCAALSEQLIESELFGHEKGSFTGATERREGRFELANRGTLLLDEVSELPLNLQAKLLRVLQEREFERVGGTKTIKVNVRILASSNRDLQDFVARGLFRSDLFYRLNVFPVEVPALRDRAEDIELFADAFLKRFSRKHGIFLPGFSDHALEALQGYRWPGNVRELQNTIERAVILSEENRPITAAALNLPTLDRGIVARPVAHEGLRGGDEPAANARAAVPPVEMPPAAVVEEAPAPVPVTRSTSAAENPPEVDFAETADDESDSADSDDSATEDMMEGFGASELSDEILPLREMEKKAILAALVSVRGNRTAAAKMLGISIRTMRNKLQEYRVEEGVPGA